jgi:hypothetical protein
MHIDALYLLSGIFAKASFIDAPPHILSQLINNTTKAYDSFKRQLAENIKQYHYNSVELDWNKISEFLSLNKVNLQEKQNRLTVEFNIKKDLNEWSFLNKVEKDIDKYNYYEKNPIKAIQTSLKLYTYKMRCHFGSDLKGEGSGSFDTYKKSRVVNINFQLPESFFNPESDNIINDFNNFDFNLDHYIDDTCRHECIHITQDIMFEWLDYIENFEIQDENKYIESLVGLPTSKSWISNKYIDTYGRIYKNAPEYIIKLDDGYGNVPHPLRPIEFYSLLSDSINVIKRWMQSPNFSPDDFDYVVENIENFDKTLQKIEEIIKTIPEAASVYKEYKSKLYWYLKRNKEKILNG